MAKKKSEKGLKGLRERASEALPSKKGSKSSGAAEKVNSAVDAVRNRVGGESRKRSKAAKKGEKPARRTKPSSDVQHGSAQRRASN